MGRAGGGTRAERVPSVRPVTLFLSPPLLTALSRLWSDLTSAIANKDMEKATEAKSAVEDAQRELRRKREESSEKHVPRFFEQRDGQWVPKLAYVSNSILLNYSIIEDSCRVPKDPEAAITAVQAWIWPSPGPPLPQR
jgi:hypothetical protein